MSKKYEGSFLSEADALEISVLCLMPDTGIQPCGIVQLVHGMSEHKERYIPFMEYLTEKGYITVSMITEVMERAWQIRMILDICMVEAQRQCSEIC